MKTLIKFVGATTAFFFCACSASGEIDSHIVSPNEIEAHSVKAEFATSLPEPFGPTSLVMSFVDNDLQSISISSNIGVIFLDQIVNDELYIDSLPGISFTPSNVDPSRLADAIVIVFEVGPPYLVAGVTSLTNSDVQIVRDFLRVDIDKSGRVKFALTKTGEALGMLEKRGH